MTVAKPLSPMSQNYVTIQAVSLTKTTTILFCLAHINITAKNKFNSNKQKKKNSK